MAEIVLRHLAAVGVRRAASYRPLSTRHLLLGFVIALVFLFGFSPVLCQKKPPTSPLDLNTATIEQLEKLPGIGATTAKAIVDFREKSGPFRRVEDLLAIRGISKARLEKLRPYVTVAPPQRNSN
jgi:competence ComEA-like helix-hairpin-helix protein